MQLHGVKIRHPSEHHNCLTILLYFQAYTLLILPDYTFIISYSRSPTPAFTLSLLTLLTLLLLKTAVTTKDVDVHSTKMNVEAINYFSATSTIILSTLNYPRHSLAHDTHLQFSCFSLYCWSQSGQICFCSSILQN